jgi:hypothetical protein
VSNAHCEGGSQFEVRLACWRRSDDDLGSEKPNHESCGYEAGNKWVLSVTMQSLMIIGPPSDCVMESRSKCEVGSL